MAKEYLLSSVHVHTKLCDGKNTPEELALSAWKAGLKTLGFSGHSHTPHDIEYCMTNARTQLYRAQVAKLKERYAGKLPAVALTYCLQPSSTAASRTRMAMAYQLRFIQKPPVLSGFSDRPFWAVFFCITTQLSLLPR